MECSEFPWRDKFQILEDKGVKIFTVYQRMVDPRLNFRLFCDWLKPGQVVWLLVSDWIIRLYFSPRVNYCLAYSNSKFDTNKTTKTNTKVTVKFTVKLWTKGHEVFWRRGREMIWRGINGWWNARAIIYEMHLLHVQLSILTSQSPGW
jgi:hypothetical protein